MTPERLHEAYASALSGLEVSDTSRRLRDAAMDSFGKLGYPSRRREDWRYTDLKPISAGNFDPTPAIPNSDQIKHAHQLLDESLLDPNVSPMVFVDGQPEPGTRPPELSGLTVLGPEQTWEQIGNLQRKELYERHPLAALNTAFASSETLIRVSEGSKIDQPLHLVFITVESGKVTQPRILIDMPQDSSLTVVQHFVGEDTAAGWTNLVTQITQDERSSLTLYRVQEHGRAQFHTELLESKLARDAHIKLGYVDLGGSLIRNDVQIDLAEPGAVCELFGVFLTSHGQHVDNHTRIDHAAPQTTSREAFRGIIGERGRGVFNGKVVVHRGAEGTDAEQSSDNLLLSERGEIDTKPELEIYTDAVKCAHGATVGELDPDQLFYMRSRGIDEGTAKGLLTFAFANDVLRRIELPEVRKRVASSIAGELPDYDSWGGLL